MANDRKKAEFISRISQANNCLCDACHGLGQVIKLEVPTTKYYDGIHLATKVRSYWLCRECRDKLVKALEWGV